MQRWELIPGAWGDRETTACLDLMRIFQQNLLIDQAKDVTDILNMGQKLERTARERYTNSVGNLRQWVSAHDFYFDSDEIRRIRSAFVILTDAPKKIRRNLAVDDEIYGVVMEIGEMVALEYGQICGDYFKSHSNNASLKDDQSATRQAIWPVHVSYDEAMKELNDVLKRLIPRASMSKNSLFDADYSEIELYLSSPILNR